MVGIGVNIGYRINGFIEPFCGLHTISKVNFGIRIHFKSLF